MSDDVPELHRPLATDRVTTAGIAWDVTATPEECAAIAARLMEPGVDALACHFELHRPLGTGAGAVLATGRGGRSGEIVAKGRLRARLQRVCVVTLEVFPVELDEEFRVVFVPEGQESEADDPDADDEVPYKGTVLDLGEAAVEQLALSLDPYPRKPGAELPPEANDEPEGPFAALARLSRQ